MKLPKGYKKYDTAEYLKTEKQIAAYLDACFKEAEGDGVLIAKALGNVARARGMTKISKASGLTRASLYKALSGDRNPSLDTVLKIIHALGLRLRVA